MTIDTVNILETRCLSSLSKVFADGNLIDEPYQAGSALWNETYAFQVAFRLHDIRPQNIYVATASGIDDAIRVRSVQLVPSEFPIYDDHDGQILRSKPGLYPDPLLPVGKDGVTAFPNQWRSVWVTIHLNKQMQSGVHPIKITFLTDAGIKLSDETFQLRIIPVALPLQQLIHTQWFHTDCLAVHYNVPVFSEQHWELIGRYVQTAADHGMNMILTPLFTPPLDTEPGMERPTVQLVEVIKDEDGYHFSFDKLSRWITLCKTCGIAYFEFSHLFTQWGAYHPPKIVATVNGVEKKIFGWETDANGKDYRDFLSAFLPALVDYIQLHALTKCVYFHISDEPSAAQVSSYKNASEIVNKYLAAFPVIDALSDYTFYKKGLVRYPIPAIDHIEPFLENDIQQRWTYYCCAQYKEVSNRFFSFPSYRNRMIGMQFYKFNIQGFLHWGYNFWFSQQSRKSINPFQNTDGGYGFPSGDAFIVYPGKDGPIESIRMEVFYDALQDLRALALLESKLGKDQVIALIEEGLDTPLTFKKYPAGSTWLLQKREKINQLIADNCL